jgi:thioredoxin-like negative regulator of GroEL
MKEIEAKELFHKLENEIGTFALFFHTPLCGTCKVAARMLEVTQNLLPQLPVYQADVNVMPSVVNRFQIASVPCVAIFRDGALKAKTYRMGSVGDLYEWLKAPK